MKILPFVFATVAILGLCVETASARNFYVELEAGHSWIRDAESSGRGLWNGRPVIELDGEMTFDTAPVFGGAFGYRFGENVRLEGRILYRNYDVTSITVNGNTDYVSTDSDTWSGMVNTYWDFKLDSPVRPYVGAGIGATRIDVNNDPNADLQVDYPDTTFTWNLMAGVYAPVSELVDVVIGYRYLESQDPSFDATYFGLDGEGESEYKTHEVSFALRFNF